MKLFTIWSGNLSHRIALSLTAWLPGVLPFLEPHVSSQEIPTEARRDAKLACQLEGTRSGIICLVPGNLTEPWLNFQAGALSQVIIVDRIHPFLVGVEPDALPGPLAQFNAIRYSKDDTRKLIHALNAEAVESKWSPDRVDHSFNICWPNLENRLKLILLDAPTSPASGNNG